MNMSGLSHRANNLNSLSSHTIQSCDKTGANTSMNGRYRDDWCRRKCFEIKSVMLLACATPDDVTLYFGENSGLTSTPNSANLASLKGLAIHLRVVGGAAPLMSQAKSMITRKTVSALLLPSIRHRCSS